MVQVVGRLSQATPARKERRAQFLAASTVGLSILPLRPLLF